MSAFEELGMMPELIKAVEDLGWVLPTPVQAEAVPLILGGGDVMAAAETGSGKTGAFALPILQVVHEALHSVSGTGASTSGRTAAATAEPVRLSEEDRDAVFNIREDGLRCQSRAENSWGGARGTLGAFAGRVYYEATVCDEGLCRVGWATLASSLDIGTDKHSFGFGGTGKKSHNKAFESYGAEYGKSDVVGCMLDADAHTISFSKNGQDLGVAFQLPQHLHGQALYPALCLKNAEMELNFGSKPFKHAAQGYIGLQHAPPHTTARASDNVVAQTSGRDEQQPLCIILEPSRDLAEQTHNCITDFARHLKSPALRSVLLVGGLDADAQFKVLKQGAEVVVGTPGRVLSFVESGKLGLNKVRFFVLDEADRLLDNKEDLMKIFRRLPKGGTGTQRLQVLLFSATLHSPEVKELAGQICVTPTLVDLKGRDAVPESVDHTVVWVDPSEDRSWLQSEPQVWTDGAHALDRVGVDVHSRECGSEATKRLKPRILQRLIDAYKMEQALIFCRTNYDCDNLEKFLNTLGATALAATAGAAATAAPFRGKRESGREHPYSCVVLAGARSMEERRAALAAFKDGDVRFMICTDVAARGIDISGLPYVINMTLPDRDEDYIHRVGRVGRADVMGLAISLVSKVPEKVWFCTQKGYKPWLEPDAKNTRTNEEGGHTMWFDEKAMMGLVEKRLSFPVPALGADLSLPAAVAARLAGGGATYGQSRSNDGAAQEAKARLDAIKQNVEVLAALEWQAQTSFLGLKRRRWGAAAAVAGDSPVAMES